MGLKYTWCLYRSLNSFILNRITDLNLPCTGCRIYVCLAVSACDCLRVTADLRQYNNIAWPGISITSDSSISSSSASVSQRWKGITADPNGLACQCQGALMSWIRPVYSSSRVDFAAVGQVRRQFKGATHFWACQNSSVTFEFHTGTPLQAAAGAAPTCSVTLPCSCLDSPSFKKWIVAEGSLVAWAGQGIGKRSRFHACLH